MNKAHNELKNVHKENEKFTKEYMDMIRDIVKDYCGKSPIDRLKEDKGQDLFSVIAEEFITQDKNTKKNGKESGSTNKQHYKDVDKKMKGYTKDMGKGVNIHPDTPATEGDNYRRLGMDSLKYDNQPSDDFIERAKEGITGSTRMGNAASDPINDKEGQDYRKKQLKGIQDKNKFNNKNNGFDGRAVVQMGDDIELSKAAPAPKKTAFESKTKILHFKKTIFESQEHIDRLIPESYKTGRVTVKDAKNNTYVVDYEKLNILQERYEPINSSYTHFAVLKSNGKIINGWDYNGCDASEIKEYAKEDMKDWDIDFNNIKVLSRKYLERQGVDVDESDNWTNDNQ